VTETTAMKLSQKITPCLWFDDQAEQAAKFYTSVFPNSRITMTNRYSEVGKEIHGRPPGSVMTVSFELDGQPFTALNGGPIFHFSEAISFQVTCATQKDIDYFWEKLSMGGDEKAQQCGWLKDRYGVSWQIVPEALPQMLSDPASPKSQNAMRAMLSMKKLDIEGLEQAYAA